LRSPRALRLFVRARRNPNALLATLLAIGILLMVLHWSGQSGAQPLPATPHARASTTLRPEAAGGQPPHASLAEDTVAAGH
jgi:hypothetical protein